MVGSKSVYDFFFFFFFMTMYEIYKCESQIKLKKECSNFQDNLFMIWNLYSSCKLQNTHFKKKKKKIKVWVQCSIV